MPRGDPDTIDARGRVVHAQVPKLEATSVTYDANGRIDLLTQGTRFVDSDDHATTGYLSKVTDGLSREVLFERDAVGRVTQTTRPGLRTIGHDADSLLTTAGAMTLGRDPDNGLLLGTTLGTVTDAITYDAWAQPATYTAAGLLDVSYERDETVRVRRAWCVAARGQAGRDGHRVRDRRHGSACR